GPVEATAAGNVIVQAMALGHISSLEQGRQVVRNSFELDVYEPGDGTRWDAAYERFLRLVPEEKV
ncbi:MAG: rhamnulokinase, partial [Delftia sp.]|nr:rhamnulokinase [Delftia sp.]